MLPMSCHFHDKQLIASSPFLSGSTWDLLICWSVASDSLRGNGGQVFLQYFIPSSVNILQMMSSCSCSWELDCVYKSITLETASVSAVQCYCFCLQLSYWLVISTQYLVVSSQYYTSGYFGLESVLTKFYIDYQNCILYSPTCKLSVSLFLPAMIIICTVLLLPPPLFDNSKKVYVLVV